MLLALGIVIALILGLYKLLRRMSGRNEGAVRADGRMTIVASTPLAHSRSLHLVRVGDELVLVGSAEHARHPASRLLGGGVAHDRPRRRDGGMRSLGPGDSGGRPGFVGSLTDSLRKLTSPVIVLPHRARRRSRPPSRSSSCSGCSRCSPGCCSL